MSDLRHCSNLELAVLIMRLFELRSKLIILFLKSFILFAQESLLRFKLLFKFLVLDLVPIGLVPENVISDGCYLCNVEVLGIDPAQHLLNVSELLDQWILH